MTKKEYQKPAIEVTGFDLDEQILVNSVGTTGLGSNNLDLDGSGNSWKDAMSRRYNNIWDDETEDW